jgi:hypothetical protein
MKKPDIISQYLTKLDQMRVDQQSCVSIYFPVKRQWQPLRTVIDSLVLRANRILKKDSKSTFRINKNQVLEAIPADAISVGIFICDKKMLVIPFPFEMTEQVIVATSFHIKPIVALKHWSVESILIHFHRGGASIFKVMPHDEQTVDSYIPSGFHNIGDWQHEIKREQLRGFLDFLKMEVASLISDSTKLIAITGEPNTIFRIDNFWRELNLPIHYYNESFETEYPRKAIKHLREETVMTVHRNYEESVSNTQCPVLGPSKFVCVLDLARSILRNQVKKLCVPLEVIQFGIIDKYSGGIKFNDEQACSNDDCIYDDLLEMAINKGIEVSVVPIEFLPDDNIFIAA